ncbi:MAG: LacI family DNA-binding transcriptional regulator [Clostridia bacterium]|nr:LacI family DNA-binding transcriptional regulator [Clostridia bacterium]
MGVTSFKKVVAQDVADAMGVALSTVNKALTGKPGVSEARRREIQQKAREMGYRADNVAQILARNPIHIGLVMIHSDRSFDDYHHNLLVGMQEEIERLADYKVRSFVLDVGESLKPSLDDLKAWVEENRIEAICFNPTVSLKGLADNLVRLRVPLVLAGGGYERTDDFLSLVEVDAGLSGRLAADFLHCACHKEIRAAILIDSEQSFNLRQKAEACRVQLEKYGAKYVEVANHNNDKQRLYEELDRLILGRPRCNCLYISTGFAVFVYEYLIEKKLTDRVTVVGTDDCQNLSTYFEKGAVDAVLLQNEKQIGARAVRLAYEYLANSRTFGMEDWVPPDRVEVKPFLCLRSYFDEE